MSQRRLLAISLVFAVWTGTGAWAGGSIADASTSSAPAEHQGGVYRRPLGNSPVTLDPACLNDIYGRTVANQIFDGLVQFDKSLAVRPAIAETWRASRDGLVWTFTLRKGVRFHNGREVTADDFVYSFTRILDPATHSTGASFFSNIRGADAYLAGRAARVEGLRALDRYTLQIELAESRIPFVVNLAVGFAKVVPREVVQQLGTHFGLQPVGTGPFKFADWSANTQIILTADPDYFEGRPHLDRLEYRIFPGDAFDAMFREFRQGQLHDSPIPGPERPGLVKKSDYHFVRQPMLGLSFLGMVTTTKPFDNPQLRQALNHAIDRLAMMRSIYRGQYPPGVGILPPGAPGHDPKSIGYPYNPQKAADLLAAAGYPGGRGLPVLQLWSGRRNDEAVAELEAVARYFAAIGVRADISYNTDWPDYKAQVAGGRYPMFRYSWYADIPDPDSFLGQLFESTSHDNLTRFQNGAVDALLRRAREEREMGQRMALYQEIERQVLGHAPLIVLSYAVYERLFRPQVMGIEAGALGDPYLPMKKIWLKTE